MKIQHTLLRDMLINIYKDVTVRYKANNHIVFIDRLHDFIVADVDAATNELICCTPKLIREILLSEGIDNV